MAIMRQFEQGKGPLDLAYRKRLWVFYWLVEAGWPLDPEQATSTKTLEQCFCESGCASEMEKAREALMAEFERQDNGWGGDLRVPASRDVLSWVADNDRRFFRWAFIYARWIFRDYFPPNLSGDFPLNQNGYISDKARLVLWFDSIVGSQEQKKELENQLKGTWHQNNEISRVISDFGGKENGFMRFFWKETLSRFEGASCHQWALFGYSDVDWPVGDDGFFYAAILIFDLLDMGPEAKKDIIRSIKKKWHNDKRRKKQVNVSLSPAAAEKLDRISQVKGIAKSEIVERWILHEEKS